MTVNFLLINPSPKVYVVNQILFATGSKSFSNRCHIKDDIANNSRAAVFAKTIDCHPDTQQREVRDLKIVF